MLKVGRVEVKIILAFLTVFCLAGAVAIADNVVEGFYEKSKLSTGQVVKLDTKPAATVEVVPANASNQIFGVVVDPSKAPITLDRANQQVFVATGGTYSVLVSNDNGTIVKGDYISISRSDGVGAKANSNQPVILGHAASGFDGVNGVKAHLGKYTEGNIDVAISVAPNPLFKNTLSIPQPLQRFGNSIAGREVPPLRVYMALLLLVVASSLAIILLVVGTRSSLIAIGRNPLSQHSILRGMIQVTGVSVAIFAIAAGGVYLLVRL